jgi:PAS domain S-box-containing protein
MNLKFIIPPLFVLAFFLTFLFIEKNNQTDEILKNGFVFYENPTRHIFKSDLVFSSGIIELIHYKQDNDKNHLLKAQQFFESSLGFMNQKKYTIHNEVLGEILNYNQEAISLTKKEYSLDEVYAVRSGYQRSLAKMEQLTWENVRDVYQIYIERDDQFKKTIFILGFVLFIFALLFSFLFHRYSKKLQQSIDNFSELLNITQEAIIIFDEKQNIINVNESAREIFNYGQKSFVGKNIFEFVPKDEIPKVISGLSKNKVSPYELNLYKADGTLFPALASGGNIVRNEKSYRVTTIVDLTNLKEKEMQLLQQSRLALLGEMIGNIAHQWRQPLSLITTTISALEFKQEYSGITKDDITKANETILNAANYLSQTIDNFRNFANQKQLSEEFIVATTIHLAVDIVKASYNNNFITLDINLDETIKYCGNKNLLSQVILNILENAKDALVANISENKIVLLSLKLENDFIVISIKDNGGGISEEIKEKIFDPYFTTKHQSQGTGLGLYMSTQIIQQHFNGTLEVFNTKDQNGYGALFIISFPIQTIDEI